MDFSLFAQTDQVMEQINNFLLVMRPDSLGDYLLYGVLILSLLTTFFLADGNDMASYLLYGTIILCLFNLTVGQQWAPPRCITTAEVDDVYSRALFVFISQIGLFLLPFIAAGSTRSKGKKGKAALPMAIVAGVVGVLYVAYTLMITMCIL